MVLSAAETTAFFQDATDMAIPNATRIAMQLEGITAVEDLADFTMMMILSSSPTT